jgi:tetratricopeptide (TPR) repeat protein
MLDNASDLDPQFMAVYSYGASVLPAIDPQQAIALTEKGIAANSEAWRLYQYLGYIHWRLKDFERAAEVYEAGAKIGGAPPFMLQMAAAMRTQGGSRDTARAMYQQMYEEAEDQQSRSNAELRLMELDSLNERDAINDVLARVRKQTGQCPSNPGEVLPLLRGIRLPDKNQFRLNAEGQLADPLGVPYVLDRERCVVELGKDSKIPKTP